MKSNQRPFVHSTFIVTVTSPDADQMYVSFLHWILRNSRRTCNFDECLWRMHTHFVKMSLHFYKMLWRLWPSLCYPNLGLIHRPFLLTKPVIKVVTIPVVKRGKFSDISRIMMILNMSTEKDNDPWDDAIACWRTSLDFFRECGKPEAVGNPEANLTFLHNMLSYPGKLPPTIKKFESVFRKLFNSLSMSAEPFKGKWYLGNVVTSK